ncbi:hypothetical protein BGZ70_003651 [Mortierella alpina]|uniref:Amino acid transporter n=1 Tax=Mortierella alpina TaxID=64518 RepID=A0A9P6LVP0_MORAP|nr:hypothetical protein BGZ70_003651 [Mortierella alpina]
MFRIVELVMNYAPIGIGCAIASTVGAHGLDALATAGKLIGTLYVTLILFAILVIFPVLLIFRFPLREFALAAGQPLLMAFATSSSESALPKAMENMVEFGVPRLLPTIFCAQVAGIEKSAAEQIVIVLTLMLTSKGVAAVPRASYIVLASTVSSANIPLAGLALVMSVDAFMDMARSAINVLGNVTACAVIAKWEGEFRNEDWIARKSGQMPETLVMDDPEIDGGLGLPHHNQQLNQHLNQHHSPDMTHSVALAMHERPLGMMHSEKQSIHSVHSVHSTISAYDPHHGSSSQQKYPGYGDTYL